MDWQDEQAWFKKCSCGKAFYKPNSYSNHIRSCQRYKDGVADALGTAKAKYANKRKQRKGKKAIESWYGEGDGGLDVDGDLIMQNLPEPPPVVHLPAEQAPAAGALGRGMRVRAPPQRFKDFLVTSAIPFDIPMFGQATESPPESPQSAGPSHTPSSPLSEQRKGVLNASEWRKTRTNGFNLYKSYWTLEDRPHDPDLSLSGLDLQEDEDYLLSGRPPVIAHEDSSNPFYPFPNWSSYKLGEWHWSDGDGKSRRSFQQLVDIIGDEDFITGDIRDTNWKKVDSLLASSEFDADLADDDARWIEDGLSWKTATVTIDVPFNSASAQPGSKSYALDDFRFRPLISVVLAKLQDNLEHFHIVPSELWWNRGGRQEDVRVHGDIYHSDAFLEAYREVQLLPPEPEDDTLPRYVVALMFASDETHLTSFGDAQLWPTYMHFGNDSKYRRGKTSLKLFEEVAYFHKLPDSFSDWYIHRSGRKTVPEDVLRHIKRELFHAQWEVLLDDEFVHAYAHGLVVNCVDGVRRRFYPRILTYSADYPERMKVVGVRTTGSCPCSRCLVPVNEIPHLGTGKDRNLRTSTKRVDDDARREKVVRARKLIYGAKNYSVKAAPVEELLKPSSLVAAKNAFSERLGPLGFDVFAVAAVDPLHEVEIGSWKSLFIHLIRLLEILATGATDSLNNRYRQVPAFGRDTIRRIRHDAAAMKQLGARDLEDLLQCSYPVFEGLLPEQHGERALDLLFTLAQWHSLAKLRMHTDLTLELMDAWTTTLGEAARAFVEKTCNCFQTRELKGEYQARKRREARKSATKDQTQSSKKGQKKAQRNNDGSQNALASGSSESARGPSDAELGPPTAAHILQRGLSRDSAAATAGPSAYMSQIHEPLSPDTTFTPGLPQVAPYSDTSPVVQSGAVQREGTDGRKPRQWSLTTPKFHALGDVVQFIRRAGTTDSYSTQLSERYHRFPKSRYRRTNKKNVPKQLSRIQARQARIKRLRNQLYPSRDELDSSDPPTGILRGDKEYFVGKSQNRPVNLPHFLRSNSNDPAVKDFLFKLRRHLFPRIIAALLEEVQANPGNYPDACLPILARVASSEPSEHDLNSIYFHSDTIYRHNILQIAYTTYDCRQAVDTINPNTSRRDFMCLPVDSGGDGESSSEGQTSDSTDYIYGRVLGIFHVNVTYGGSGSLDYRRRRFDFIWARRYIPVALQDCSPEGPKRLDRVKLAPMFDPGSWDFIDPAQILRGAHIIPRFSLGKLYDDSEEGNQRLFSKAAQDRLDWAEYYVNRFVDRDMTMRFLKGFAVGHSYWADADLAPPPTAFGMDIDGPGSGLPPALTKEDTTQDDDDISYTSDEDPNSAESSRACSEPDSEEEPDIYQ